MDELTPEAVAKHAAEHSLVDDGRALGGVWRCQGERILPFLALLRVSDEHVEVLTLDRLSWRTLPETWRDYDWTPVLPNGGDLPNESTTSILDAYTSGRRDGSGELLTEMARPRPLDDWHEDYGSVLWWTLPVESPPWCGRPDDSDWPDYHTHWTPLGPTPGQPEIWGKVTGCKEEPGSSAAARAAAAHALAVGEAYDRGRDDECSRWAEAIRDAGAGCHGFLDDGTTVEEMLDDLVAELVRAHRPAPEPSDDDYDRGRADERAAIVDGLELLAQTWRGCSETALADDDPGGTAQTYRERGKAIEMACDRLKAGEWSTKP